MRLKLLYIIIHVSIYPSLYLSSQPSINACGSLWFSGLGVGLNIEGLPVQTLAYCTIEHN